MHVSTIINRLKSGLLKEESLRPYRQPPFNEKEWSSPVSQDVPPFMNGGRGNEVGQKAAPFPANAPNRGGNLNSPPKATLPDRPINGPTPAFGPNTQKRKPETVIHYLSIYINKFNMILSDIASGNPITKEVVKDEFIDFLGNEMGDVTVHDPDKEKKLEALRKMQDKFNEIYQNYQEDGINDTQDIDPAKAPKSGINYPDMSDNKILALFDANRKTKGSAKAAIAFMDRLPEITQNDNNYAAFQRLRPELETRLIKSSLSDNDRQELYNVFMASYLDDKKAVSKEEKSKVVKRYTQILNEKAASDSLSGKRKKKNPNYNNDYDDIYGGNDYDSMGSNEEPPIDPFAFLKEELFQSDVKNKDLFLAFFNEKDMLNTTAHILGENTQPEEAEILSRGAGSYRSEPMGVLQNHAELLKDALIGFMSDKASPMHDKFFNWVLGEIRKYGKRKNPPNVMQESDPTADDLSGNDLSIRPDRQFATDFRLPLPEEIFKEEGLRNEGTPVEKGSDVDSSTLASLENNWKKIDGFIGDLLQKMADIYGSTPNDTPSSKDIKLNILEKSILWARVQRSCNDSVNHVIETAHRTGKNLTDARSISILNQDWDTLFKQDHWRDFGWGVEDSEDVKAAVQMAIDDQLVVSKDGVPVTDPNAVYQSIVGKVDFKGNVGVFQKGDEGSARDNTANALSLRSKSKLTALKDIIIDKDLVDKYGGDTLVSFLDIIGFDKFSAVVGSLLSQNNRGSFEDKINYLTELSRRGVIKTQEQEIEHMSPKEISDIFAGVKETLKLIYSPKSELRKVLSDPVYPTITNEYVAELAKAAGVPNIKSKEDFGKARSSEKTAIVEKFYDTEYGKYYVEEFRPLEALKEFLGKHISQTSDNPQFLQQHGFTNKNEFLSSIGVTDPSNIMGSIEDMPQRRYFQIAQKFYPKLYAAHRNGVLQKTLASKDKGNIQGIVESLLEKPPVGKALWDKPPLAEALFFADALDARDKTPVTAAVKLHILQKIASQKRINQLAAIRQRMINLNVDTSIIDSIVAKIGYGRS